MRKEYKKAKNYRTSYCSTLGTSSIHVFESCRVDPNFANTQAPLLIPGGIEDRVRLRNLLTEAQILDGSPRWCTKSFELQVMKVLNNPMKLKGP